MRVDKHRLRPKSPSLRPVFKKLIGSEIPGHTCLLRAAPLQHDEGGLDREPLLVDPGRDVDHRKLFILRRKRGDRLRNRPETGRPFPRVYI